MSRRRALPAMILTARHATGCFTATVRRRPCCTRCSIRSHWARSSRSTSTGCLSKGSFWASIPSTNGGWNWAKSLPPRCNRLWRARRTPRRRILRPQVCWPLSTHIKTEIAKMRGAGREGVQLSGCAPSISVKRVRTAVGIGSRPDLSRSSNTRTQSNVARRLPPAQICWCSE